MTDTVGEKRAMIKKKKNRAEKKDENSSLDI